MKKDVKISAKQRRKRKKAMVAAAITAMVAIAVLVIVIAAQKIGGTSVRTMASDTRDYFMGMGSGEGFPYAVKSADVEDIRVSGSKLNLLLSDRTLTLTSTAKEIGPQQHTYSSPMMKTSGSQIIVYDLDSGCFRVQNGTEIVKDYKLENRITAADIGKKGNYAVGTYGKDVSSVLTVYNKRHKEIFIWKFKTERITDISLSDNGRYVAVTTIDSKNAVINSKLYVFNFKSDKYVSRFDYDGTTLVRVNYIKANDIAAVGDNLRTFIKNNRDRTDDEKFGSDSLKAYSINDKGCSSLVLSRYSSPILSNVSIYNNRNKKLFSTDFDKQIKWVDFDGRYFAVLFENEVRMYNKKGKQVGSAKLSGVPVRVAVNGSKTYVLTSVGISCFKTRADTAAD